jgi:hypothetical protein
MDANEIIGDMRRQLTELRDKGESVVPLERLERYCDVVEKNISASIEHIKMGHASGLETMRLEHLNKLEEFKVQRTADIEGYKARVAAYLESFKSTIDAGREALKVVVLINGGAAVVLVGFLGSVASRDRAGPLGLALTDPLASFGVGLVCGAVGFGVRYLAQGLFTGFDLTLTRRTAGWTFNVLSIALAIAAYSCFVWGLWSAKAAFVSHFAMLPAPTS